MGTRAPSTEARRGRRYAFVLTKTAAIPALVNLLRWSSTLLLTFAPVAYHYKSVISVYPRASSRYLSNYGVGPFLRYAY